jgi:hypothetical protein
MSEEIDQINKIIEIADMIITQVKDDLGDNAGDSVMVLGAALDALYSFQESLGIDDNKAEIIIETIQHKLGLTDEEIDEAPEEGALTDEEIHMMTVESEEEAFEPSNYSQFMLIEYIASNPELWVMSAPIIKAEYFDPENRPTIKFIQKYWSDHSALPSKQVIRGATGVKLSTPDDAMEDHLVEHMSGVIETFCRSEALHIKLNEAADALAQHNHRLPADVINAVYKDMEEITRITLSRDLGFEVHESGNRILTKAKDNVGISTGLKLLDRALDDGVTRPSFNIVSGASGDGKSIWLQNMAANYSNMGHNVLFYTLELEPEIIEQRFAAIIGGVDIRTVFGDIGLASRRLKMAGKGKGKIFVKKFPMTGTTMADIAAHYNDITLKEGIKFGVVCIDYIDVLNPIENVDKGNIHLKDKYVSLEMNDFFHLNNIIGWSASQQIKGAQDEKGARQSGVSGGTDKVNTADNLFILKRTDENRAEQLLWIHIKKARSSGGINAQIPIHWDDPGTLRQSDGDIDLFEEANPFLAGKKTKDVIESADEERSALANDAIFNESALQPAKRGSKKSKVVERAENTADSLRKAFKAKHTDKKVGDKI